MRDEIGKSWLGGCFVSKIDKQGLLNLVYQWVQEKNKGKYITAVNVSKLVMMQKDSKLADYMLNSTINIADGFPIFLGPKLLGNPIPGRITGVELMEDLLVKASKHRYRIFFLGSKQTVLEKMIKRCQLEHPGMIVAGSHDGYFDHDDEVKLVAEIAATEPDILFIALGVPQKEYFVHDHIDRLNTVVCLPIGGAFDVYAGTKVRAPSWAQNIGMEWLWRSFYDRSRAMLIYRSILSFSVIFFKDLWQKKGLGIKGRSSKC
ncbi:MAG: WecB/TagA/CpsF family glycosyltransferase [Candidatus Brocadiaceae bacterium]|nr:WecB/TagA/CpsF family glycosyltransferase [Candidatus Brocadiaceae bacterium]